MIKNFTLFGELFNNIRSEKKLSLEKLSEISGISVKTIHKIERGTSNFRVNTLSELSIHLDTDLFKLLTECEADTEKRFTCIVEAFSRDLYHYDFRRTSDYTFKLDELYSEIPFDANSSYSKVFFDNIEKAQLWIKAVELSCIESDFNKAEETFLSALRISHPNFSYENKKEHSLSTIDQHILHSYSVNIVNKTLRP